MDYRDMGMKIRTLRRQLGITQDELAVMVGVSASFLGHIERGTRTVSIDTLAALCNTLGVSPSYLMESAMTSEAHALPHDLTETEKQQLNELISFYLNHIRPRLHAAK